MAVAGSDRSIVFLYGTLKHGFPNFREIPSGALFLGTAQTTVPFPLVLDTDMYVPYMLNLPNEPGAHCVHGELYSVTEREADVLDIFEGIPIKFYSREAVEVIVTDEGDSRACSPDPCTGAMLPRDSVLKTTCYFRSDGGPEWALSWTVERLRKEPMLARYTLEEAKLYTPRYQRKR